MLGDDKGSPSQPLPAPDAVRLVDVAEEVVVGLRLARDPWTLAEAVVREFAREPRLITVLAAHVTSLNHLTEPGFVTAFNSATGAHADGISWSLIAAAGGQRVAKVATSDLAPVMMDRLAHLLGRAVRLAVIGGEPETGADVQVARRAADELQRNLPVEIVFTDHGFQASWEGPLERLRASNPDLILVGMGMPTEARWVVAYRRQFPPAVLVTCGGWLRILAGDEDRAPLIAQRWHLEWLHRLLTDPGRTSWRYAVGSANLVYRSSQALTGRVRSARRTRLEA